MSVDIHGTSIYLASSTGGPAGFIGAMEYYDFAPCPCSLIGCCAPEAQKKRMYAHVYEQRLEYNFPIAPWCCLTCDEKCVQDMPMIHYFDKPPNRVGMCCFTIPCTCCGPPVIFAYKPKCLCIELSDLCGDQVKAAPSNYFGLKMYLCCGNPCYTTCSVPIFQGVKNPEKFLSAWKFAIDHYSNSKSLDKGEMAIFEAVSDNVFDFGAAKGIQDPALQQNVQSMVRA
jgi:hypothetical protein